MTSKSLTQSSWLPVLAGGAVIGVALGIRHVQGLFLVPVTMGHGWTRETFGLAIALQNLIWGAAQPFAGMLADRYGAAKVVVAVWLVSPTKTVVMPDCLQVRIS